MKNVTGLTCVICDKTYPADYAGYVCTDHGNEGILDVRYDYDTIAAEWTKEDLAANRDRTMWRYKPLMPVAPDAEVPQLTVGGTPMYDAAPLASDLGIAKVWVKDEGRQPTASLKDRASAMAVVKAREVGAEVVTTASTGNAAAALSGISASIGQKNVIFVPKSAPEAKIAQLLAYGSTVALVNGNYGDAFELCMLAAAEYGWYNRNTGYNPFMTEGKKTAGFEILEDLGWNSTGCDLRQRWRRIDHRRRSQGSQRRFGPWLDRQGATDLRDPGCRQRLHGAGLRVWRGHPHQGSDCSRHRCRLHQRRPAPRPHQSNGRRHRNQRRYIRVSDDEILAALPLMASGSGVFAEPAGAAAYAGLIKAVAEGLVTATDEVVVLSTGSGLKDVASAMKAVTAAGTTPMVVDPTLEALKQALSKGAN